MDEVEKKIAEKLGFRATTDDRFKLLEMHVELDLAGHEHKDDDGEPTGIALPYIVTIEKGTSNILAIRKNWKEDDDLQQKRNHFVHYGYIPGFGFYNFGLIHLVGAFAKSGTSLIRQLVDAGTLSNLPGGFKTRGLRVKGDDTPIAPGEFRDVDVPSGAMRDNIMPLPYKEPSQVLMALLTSIVEEGRKFAGSAELQASDMSANAPVGTTLAILERTLKTMSAVQARIHYSMKQEFQLLKEIIRDYTPEEYEYDPEEGDRRAKKSDYDLVYVLPVSDPNAATMAQKVVQYQAALQLAQTAPQLYDLPLLHRQMLDVLGIKNYQKLVPLAEDMIPTDPVSENQNVIKGKPIKAFLYQDHEAHISVHQAAMQDPKIQKLVGLDPQMAQAMHSAMTAHIMEHLGFEYRKQIEQQMGSTLPPYQDPDSDTGEDRVMPPDMEVKVSQMAAQAAQKLLQQNKQQDQQQQNQQMQQDPIIQMQQQELQLKQQELQRKSQKDQIDAQFQAQKLAIEQQRLQGQQYQAGAQLALKAHTDKAQMAHQQKTQGFNAAIDAHKFHADKQHASQSSKQEHMNNLHNTFNDQEHEKALEALRQRTQDRLAQERQTTKPKE
jgi:hypothetical protein